MIIDYKSDVPIYEQVCREIILGIARGDLQRGQALPSVRKLAEEVGVNLHTIHKAYNQLKDMGYVNVDRRVGVTIADQFGDLDEKTKENFYKDWEVQLADVYNRGVTKSDVLDMIEKFYESFEGREKR